MHAASPSRAPPAAALNLFLQTLVLFNSDVATDTDNLLESRRSNRNIHVSMGFVYDYYFKRFSRHGMDDREIEVDSIVHPLSRSEANRQPPDVVNTYINNAFYCCDGLLVFGDGDGRTWNFLAGGFDVVAHEWTHGVTDFTSQLIYRDEPGALNEAFSDIMGAAIEFYYQPAGSGRDQADWLIAEDVYLAFPGYLRSLSDPNSKGHPDHYSLRRYLGTDTDDGGVHFNMTIATHAFYLAVAGGRNRVSGITVPGIGVANIERMERVFYRAFTQLMGPNSQFSDVRRATLASGVGLVRWWQQRTGAGGARLERRGCQRVRAALIGACVITFIAVGPADAQERLRISANVGQQASTTTMSQEQSFDSGLRNKVPLRLNARFPSR